LKSVRCPSFDEFELADSPVDPDWILDGTPVAKSREWATSSDGTVTMAVWSCTAGTFRWNFTCDELVHILDGEVFVTDADGSEFRLGPRDAVLFPAGSWTTWHVPEYVQKYAVLRSPVPKPVRLFWRALSRAKALGRTRSVGSPQAAALLGPER
jgi:uncharacterized cupin superfamily protein